MNRIVEIARDWIDTPFIHQGRVKNEGVDCVGLLEGIAFELGIIPDNYEQILNYPRDPNGTMTLLLDRWLDKKDKRDLRPGDILFFKMANKNMGQHVAIYTEINTMIHAYAVKGRVLEMTFGGAWPNRLLAAYKYRGIQ